MRISRTVLISTSALIACLSAIAVLLVFYPGDIEKSKPRAARLELQQLAYDVILFSRLHAYLPTPEEGLSVLVKGDDPIIRVLPRDPWGAPYAYSVGPRTGTFRLSSSGADGVFDTGDDVIVELRADLYR